MGFDKFYRPVVFKSGSKTYRLVVYSQALNDYSNTLMNANSAVERTFTVTGLTTDDVILSVNHPGASSLGSGSPIGIIGMRVSAANTLALTFNNPWGTAGTPSAGTYKIVAIREVS